MFPATNKISRLIYPITEKNPINFAFGLHKTATESRYDMHFGIELGLVLSGTMLRYYPHHHQQCLESGQVWFCGIWEPHGFKVIKAPCEVLVWVIWPPLLSRIQFEEAPDINWMAPFQSHPSRPLPFDKSKRILERGRELKHLVSSNRPLDKATIRIGLLDILTTILETYPKLIPRNDYTVSDSWTQLNRAVQLVFESSSFVSVSSAAKICGFNRNVFSRLFKSWMGISFPKFALSYRLKSAAERLLESSEPIKSVATQLGFVDASHFNRLFTRHYGCHPNEFRRQKLKQTPSLD